MDPVIAELLKVAIQTSGTVLGAAIGLLPVVIPVAVPLLFPLVRTFAGRWKGEAAVGVVDALERAIKPALSVAVVELENGLEEARLPSSASGGVITTEEYKKVLAIATDAAWKSLDGQGLLADVVKSYGGEAAVKASLIKMLERDLAAKHGIQKPGV